MTMKRSQFGSLADRLGLVETAPEPVVRHVWVDGAVPGLVMDRRRDGDGRWEGLVVFVSAGEVHREWISGARISKVDQAR